MFDCAEKLLNDAVDIFELLEPPAFPIERPPLKPLPAFEDIAAPAAFSAIPVAIAKAPPAIATNPPAFIASSKLPFTFANTPYFISKSPISLIKPPKDFNIP